MKTPTADNPLAWAQGRRVAIRPDGARRSFNPTATCLLRTDTEHQRFAAMLKTMHANATTPGHNPFGGGS